MMFTTFKMQYIRTDIFDSSSLPYSPATQINVPIATKGYESVVQSALSRLIKSCSTLSGNCH